VIAQPTGQTELLEGTATVNDDQSLTMVLGYSVVANTSTAKHVEQTMRHYVFNTDRSAVYTEYDMAAEGEQMQQHLSSELHKTMP
ncbi:MAG: FABP family protein, partial [Yaniella sp.]